MPSLIYIARIRSLSEELAQSLRSAGCHVESFKPGDITEDECLLAMTSEALGATLNPEGDRAETDQKLASIPPAPKMNGQLGSQAAIWNSIKTAVIKESHANVEQAAPDAPAVEPEAMEPGFTPTEVGRRALSNAKGKSSGEIAWIEPSQTMPVSSAEIPRDPRKSRPTIREQCYRVFRNPLSTVVALLVFAVVYRGVILPSTTSARMVRKTNDYTRSDPNSTNSLLRVSASPRRTSHRLTSPLILSSAEPPQAAERVRRHLSDDNFVAQDFTNHLMSPAPSGATRQNPELKSSRSAAKPKRIVVD
jgi:hypothetical protein